ncbi:UNVERIFIED_CONTAM: hypothetical protein K2H54_015237 [Gekko kuhli]
MEKGREASRSMKYMKYQKKNIASCASSLHCWLVVPFPLPSSSFFFPKLQSVALIWYPMYPFPLTLGQCAIAIGWVESSGRDLIQEGTWKVGLECCHHLGVCFFLH